MDESKEVPSPLELHKMMDWRDELLIRLGHPCIFENGMFVPDPNWDPYAGFSPKLQSKYLFVDRTNFHNVDINDFLGLNRHRGASFHRRDLDSCYDILEIPTHGP